jgi:hypothetical protein
MVSASANSYRYHTAKKVIIRSPRKPHQVMSQKPPTPQQHERYGIGDDGLGGSLYGLVCYESFHSFNNLISLFLLQQRTVRLFLLPSWAMRRAANMVTK